MWTSDRSGQNRLWITHSTATLTPSNTSGNWSGIQNITWTSISGDWQNDTFNLSHSTDNVTWTTFATGIPADSVYTNKSYAWDTRTVPDGNYSIRIIRNNSNTSHTETNQTGNFTINNPPWSVSNLAASVTQTSINWTWTKPTQPDFNYTMVFLDGTFTKNTSAAFYLASGLSSGTTHTIATRTVDTAGNINDTWVNLTATTSVPATTTSSSGGGGSAAVAIAPSDPLVAREVQVYVGPLFPGQPKAVELPGLPVERLELQPKASVIGASITAQQLREIPADTKPPQGSIHSVLKVVPENLRDDALEKVVLRFRVEDGWLAQRGLRPADVAMGRYDTVAGVWAKLPTKSAGGEAYKAESPGLSLFAVAASGAATPTPLPVASPAPSSPPIAATPPPASGRAPAVPTPRQPGFEALAALAALGMAVVILRRSRGGG